MYKKFINLYPIQKTLRFELIPQGKTLENMKKNNVIQDDERKAESYKKAKKIIDEYHKKFIEDNLKTYKIDEEDLEKYYLMINDKNRNKDEFDKLKSILRKSISDKFTKNPEYKKIFGKEIIEEILPNFTTNLEDLRIIEEFNKFTTYFSGFNENRKNMYVAEEKSTSIAYRLIDENLPIFISNINKFEHINKVIPKKTIEILYKELEEIIQVDEIKEMFELGYYNDVLTQKGIEVYNQIIGGVAKDDGRKFKGLNEYINEYKQKHPEDKIISKLSVLHKQILSDTSTASFVIEKIENDKQLLEIVKDLTIEINKNVIESEQTLQDLIKNISEYDLAKIFVKNDLSLTEISQYLYNDWSIINQGISDEYDNQFKTPKNAKSKNYEENKKKYLKSKRNLTIQYLNECTKDNENFVGVETYFAECSKKSEKGNKEDIFEKVINAYKKIEKLLNEEYPETKNLKKDEENIYLIKEYLDALKEIQLFVKPLVAVRFEVDQEKDNAFYDNLFKYWDVLQNVTGVYNKVRNYLTGKPYSTNKIKLNFRNQTLLDGWALGNEIANSSLLFKKDNNYYLGIINNYYNSEFKNYEEPLSNDDILYKMEYLQAADPQKDVQNLIEIEGKTVKKNGRKNENGENVILEELKNKYLPEEINVIRKRKSYSKTSENFSKEDLIKFIDYYKIRVCEYYSKFRFSFKKSSEYRDFGQFTDHINEQAYQIIFKGISYSQIYKMVDEGKLYLFKIYNKDFSENSHGTPNLHTIYWKMLFDEKNLEKVIYKLNGQAEIFYRKASIDRKITHPKNIKIDNKNKNNKRKQSEFEYDLIKDRRFTEDKFQFHVPITLNFNNYGITNINEEVNKQIKQNEDNYIIGIDRGERHLLYLSLINSKGEIIEQYSLNNIINEYKGIKYETNYHELLDKKEKERDAARESWQSIENIKELKEGYLSQVISKITDLMIKYNAIVVLEDLNSGFMRGRQKVEKQVYQKFEKMLIDKLNYLVKKDRAIESEGGVLRAYQLTNQFESFKKMRKQSGVLYYIPAWNTSKMDPVTGFVNLFYIKYKNEEDSKEFVRKIDNIKYNSEKDYFEFDIDYNKFTTKAEGTKTKWTLCTYGNRIRTFRNPAKNSQWDNEEISLSLEFKKLFEKYEIDYKNSDIKSQILEISGKDFWENLINLFKLMLQMRNSITGKEKDYIISPVADENGEFFDSNNLRKGLPENADANGAYNIARKGLWIVEQIKNTPDEKLKNIKLAISNKEWLQFIQKKEDK